MDPSVSSQDVSASQGQLQWLAVLREDYEIIGYVFQAGQLFTIFAPSRDDGSIDLPLVADAISLLHEGLSFRIPTERFDVSSNPLCQLTSFKTIVPPTNLENWNSGNATEADLEIHIQEPFGKLFLDLAKGLKVNARSLAALGCYRDVVNMLELRFSEVFLDIYNSIPQEHKRTLSEAPIKLLHLEPLVPHGVGNSPEIRKFWEPSSVFLTIFHPNLKEIRQKSSGDEQTILYLGFRQTKYLHKKRFDHFGNPVTWKSWSGPVFSADKTLLCKPSYTHRAVLLIAEQLFRLFLNHLEEVPEESVLSPKKIYRDIRARIWDNIREAARIRSCLKPAVSDQPKEWSQHLPFYRDYQEHWICQEMVDRYIFAPKERRTMVGPSYVHNRWQVNIFGDLTVCLPRNMFYFMLQPPLKVSINIEIMKNGPHPHSLARRTNISSLSNLNELNAVGISIFWERTNGRPIVIFADIGELGRTTALTIDETTIKVPSVYCDCIMVRNSLLRQGYKDESRVDRRLHPRDVTVVEIRYRESDRQVDFILTPTQINNCLPTPSFTY